MLRSTAASRGWESASQRGSSSLGRGSSCRLAEALLDLARLSEAHRVSSSSVWGGRASDHGRDHPHRRVFPLLCDLWYFYFVVLISRSCLWASRTRISPPPFDRHLQKIGGLGQKLCPK